MRVYMMIKRREKKRIVFERAHLHIHPIYDFLFFSNPKKRDSKRKRRNA